MTYNISCPNRRYTYIRDVLNVVVCVCGGGGSVDYTSTYGNMAATRYLARIIKFFQEGPSML